MTNAETCRIYVYLLDEGTDVWAPVDAERVGDDLYRIVSENSDPDDECWEFTTGEVVRCIPRIFSGGAQGLVAVARLEPGQH